MGKRVRSAADASANWASAMQNGTTAAKYKQGVASVTVSPTSQAATPEALNRYLQSVNHAVSSGKMAAKLQATTLQAWQAAASGRGATNLASGATKAKAKVDAAMQRLQPVWQAMSDAANNLPRGAKGDISAGMARIQAALQVQQQMTRT